MICSSLIMLLPAIIELTMADDVEDEGDDDNGCDNLCFLCGGWPMPVDASKFVSLSILRKFLKKLALKIYLFHTTKFYFFPCFVHLLFFAFFYNLHCEK